MKTEKSATALLSLADIARALAGADQRRWLKQYTCNELADLLWRYKNGVAVVYDEAGKLAGVAIHAPNGQVAGSIHIAFIISLVKGTMGRFMEMLRRIYPNTTEITFIRRGELQRIPVAVFERLVTTQEKFIRKA